MPQAWALRRNRIGLVIPAASGTEIPIPAIAWAAHFTSPFSKVYHILEMFFSVI